MIAASLFTGCGCIDYAAERAGFELGEGVELDPVARGVLAHRWPRRKFMEDAARVSANDFASGADVVVFGSPCQDWSVAGRGLGLGGDRAPLVFEGVRVADEIGAGWMVWENVDHLLSRRHAHDFAVILGAITGWAPEAPASGRWGSGGVCVGPRRWAAWRILDAQHFGTPLRRRRLVVVAGPGERPRIDALFDAEALRGDAAPGPAARDVFASDPESHSFDRFGAEKIVTFDLDAPTSLTASGRRSLSGIFCLTTNSKTNWSEGTASLVASHGPGSYVTTWRRELGRFRASVPRRISPVEQERLLGLPDDWTRRLADGREASRTAREKMAGNGASVPAFEWLFRRLLKAMRGETISG